MGSMERVRDEGILSTLMGQLSVTVHMFYILWVGVVHGEVARVCVLFRPFSLASNSLKTFSKHVSG